MHAVDRIRVRPVASSATEIRLLLTAGRFAAHHSEWTFQVDGAEAVLAMLGG